MSHDRSCGSIVEQLSQLLMCAGLRLVVQAQTKKGRFFSPEEAASTSVGDRGLPKLFAQLTYFDVVCICGWRKNLSLVGIQGWACWSPEGGTRRRPIRSAWLLLTKSGCLRFESGSGLPVQS
jgi:hypothetical protein